MEDKLTPKQVAAQLGYHVNHVYRLLKSGAIRGDQFNRAWMIDPEEVGRVRRLREERGRYWKE